MNIAKMKPSKFLKKEEVDPAVGVTITNVTYGNVAPQGQAPDKKHILHFEETEKPLVLNSTNIDLVALVTGENDSDNWAGKQIALYLDPSVSYGGKRIGGIRVRKYNNEPAPEQAEQEVEI